MRNLYTGQVGDLSHDFALWTYFPQKLHQSVNIASQLCYAMINLCGVMNSIRRYQEGKSVFNRPKPAEPAADSASSKDDSTKSIKTSSKKGDDLERQNSGDIKKKALDFLDEEIESLAKKKGEVVNVSEAKFAQLQQQALNGFMNDFTMGSDSSDTSMKKMNFGKVGKRS